MKKKIVGIFSSGKSGTTLLIRLLDKYLNCFVYPEEINFLSVFADNLKYPNRISKQVHFNMHSYNTPDLKIKLKKTKSFYSYYSNSIDAINENVIKFNKIDTIEYNKDFLKNFDGSYQDFINEYLSSVSVWLLNKKFEINIFKTLETNYLEKYLDIDNIKFIHLIRNPHDVYASLVRSSRYSINPKKFHSFYLGEDNMENILRRWKNHVNFLDDIKFNNQKHFILKYEDLIKNFSGSINSICNFLNLKRNHSIPDETLTLLKNKNYKFSQYTSSDQTNLNLLNKIIDTKKTFDYNKELITNNENLLINLLCKKEILKLNYKYHEKEINKIKIFINWILPMKWEFKYLGVGLFLRRKKFIKYRYFFLKFYLQFILSVYYYLYRRLKLIIYGI